MTYINKLTEVKTYLLDCEKAIADNYSFFEALNEILEEQRDSHKYSSKEVYDIYWAIWSYYCEPLYVCTVLVQEDTEESLAKRICDNGVTTYDNEQKWRKATSMGNVRVIEGIQSPFMLRCHNNCLLEFGRYSVADWLYIKGGFGSLAPNEDVSQRGEPFYDWQIVTKDYAGCNHFGLEPHRPTALLEAIIYMYSRLDFKYSTQPTYYSFVEKYTPNAIDDSSVVKVTNTTQLEPTKHKGKRVTPLRDCLLCDESKKDAVLGLLHQLIDGKKGKLVGLAILALKRAGLATQITFAQAQTEFGEIGAESGYNKYAKEVSVKGCENFSEAEINPIMKRLKDIAGL